jgi:hypothetical protein
MLINPHNLTNYFRDSCPKRVFKFNNIYAFDCYMTPFKCYTFHTWYTYMAMQA